MLSSVNRVNMKYIGRLFANTYVLTFAIFMVWLTFFDKNNLITLRCIQGTIDDLEAEKAYFETELTKLDAQMHTIEIDRERYARENFYLHKDNEIVFLVR